MSTKWRNSKEDACFYVFIRFGVHFLHSVNDVMVNSVKVIVWG